MTHVEKMVEKFKKSGKSQREWCREAGIKRSTLRYWLERSEELAEGKEICFARIVECGEKSAEPHSDRNIHFHSQCRYAQRT